MQGKIFMWRSRKLRQTVGGTFLALSFNISCLASEDMRYEVKVIGGGLLQVFHAFDDTGDMTGSFLKLNGKVISKTEGKQPPLKIMTQEPKEGLARYVIVGKIFGGVMCPYEYQMVFESKPDGNFVMSDYFEGCNTPTKLEFKGDMLTIYYPNESGYRKEFHYQNGKILAW